MAEEAGFEAGFGWLTFSTVPSSSEEEEEEEDEEEEEEEDEEEELSLSLLLSRFFSAGLASIFFGGGLLASSLRSFVSGLLLLDLSEVCITSTLLLVSSSLGLFRLLSLSLAPPLFSSSLWRTFATGEREEGDWELRGGGPLPLRSFLCWRGGDACLSLLLLSFRG